MVAAVLTTVTLGVLGAAAGSWAGEHTFADLPSATATQDILHAAVADPVDLEQPSQRWNQPGNGTAAYVTLMALPEAQSRGPEPTWTVEQARDGLTAAGWKITEFTVRPMPTMDGTTRLDANTDLLTEMTVNVDPAKERASEPYQNLRRYAVLTAERNGLTLHVTATDAIGGDTSDPSAKVYRGGINGKVYAARSAAYLPLTVVGALLGALAGWLLTATAAHRVRPLRPARRQTTTLLTGVALATAALPVYAVVRNATLLVTHLGNAQPVYTLHSVLRPGWWYLAGLPARSVPTCVIAAGAAGVLALISTWSRTPPGPESTAQPS